MEVGYYGCLNSVGHFSHGPCWRQYRVHGEWVNTDAGFMHPRRHGMPLRPEGSARLTYTDEGWTVLSFADRSIDQRGDSHSTFTARGRLTGAEMMKAAQEAWPDVWARYPFQVRVVSSL